MDGQANNRQIERQSKLIDRQTDMLMLILTEKQIDRQSDRHIHRQIDKWVDRSNE